MDECPNCGNPHLTCDEVDIGVGVMKGNWRCDKCEWYEPPYEGLTDEDWA